MGAEKINQPMLLIIFAGRFNIAFIKSKTPSIAIPTNLNGIRISQMNGYVSNKTSAKGQQRTNKMNQRIIFMITPKFSLAG